MNGTSIPWTHTPQVVQPGGQTGFDLQARPPTQLAQRTRAFLHFADGSTPVEIKDTETGAFVFKQGTDVIYVPKEAVATLQLMLETYKR